jgi:dUTP pyrophosphatase
MKVKIQKTHPEAKTPQYAHEGDAGMDLYTTENTTIKPQETKTIPTGLKIQIEPGHEAQIRPKSGLAANHSITVLNTPGTIDAGYRGEIKVILINHGKQEYKIEKGQKIAQIVFKKTETAQIEEVTTLQETTRGEKGFGSTGLH